MRVLNYQIFIFITLWTVILLHWKFDQRLRIISAIQFRTSFKLNTTLLTKIEHRMAVRRKLLQKRCAERRLSIPGKDIYHKPDPWEFLVNDKYRLIWCNIFKAASSTWMHNFNLLAGYSVEYLKNSTEPPLELARKVYPRVSLDKLQMAQQGSITFIIVRHPFERLLSAYIDKFLYPLPNSYHDILGKKIVRFSRRNETGVFESSFPTFSEFVNWFITVVKKLKPKSIDQHLISQTLFCTPCLIHFDMILKIETFEEDQQYLIDRADLSSILNLEWRNAGKANKTPELIEEYFSKLTFAQLDDLYRYYRNDFEIFGYSASRYFELVRPE